MAFCPKEAVKKAMELGATDAKIIPAKMILIQDEVIEMCRPPLCEGYGKSTNCPPHVMSPEEARGLVAQYESALIFKIDFPSEILLSEDRFNAFGRVYEVASEMEAWLRGAGYTLSKGFAAGSCKPVFCRDIPCPALIDGGLCRYPSLARPSMEAVGMNVFQLVRDVGWEIHRIGRATDPRTIPNGILVGLILVT